jgi:endonuclease III-like uncharacterized protein
MLDDIKSFYVQSISTDKLTYRTFVTVMVTHGLSHVRKKCSCDNYHYSSTNVS